MLDVALLSSRPNFPFLPLNCTEAVPSRHSGRKLNLIFLFECNAANFFGKYTKAENSPA